MGNNKFFERTILWFAMLCLFFLAAFKPIGIDNDSINYQSAIINFYKGSFDIKEPTFLFFSYLSDAFFNKNIRVVFFLYAFLAVIIKAYAISKYSSNILLSLLIYSGMFFILHDLTQIRVGLAAAFFLLAIPDLINEKKKSFLIKIFIACLCHLSAIILLPLLYLSPRKINFKLVLASPILMLCIIFVIGDMNPFLLSLFKLFPEPFSTKGTSYILGVQQFGRFDEVNVYSKFTLSSFFFFIVYLVATLKSKSESAADIIYLKLLSLMLTCFYLFSSVPVLASRTFELFAVSFIFSFPAMANKFKPVWASSLLISLWVCLYFYLVNLKLIGI
jgi:hypothetical protein